MSRTKVQHQPYKPVEFYAGTEPAEWNDMLRGILVALVGQHPVLWNVSAAFGSKPAASQFKTAKEKILEVLSSEVATVLQNTDAKMNVWAVLEKWCWMMEMYARSVEFRFTWRYTNSMNYLANSPPTSLGAYLCCLTNNRFVELTKKYATTPEEHAAKEFALTAKKCRKVSLGFSMFAEELALYSEIVKSPAKAPAPIAVVVSSADGTPIQLLPSPSPASLLLQPTVSQPSDIPVRTRRGRSAAKYGTRSRASSTHETILPTSVSEILNSLASSVAATSAVPCTSSPTTASSPPIAAGKEAAAPRTAKIKEEVVETAKAEEELNSGDLTLTLIDAVKERPEIWDHNAFLTPDRCRLWKEVVSKMRKLPNSESVNESNIVFSWRQLVEYVRSPPLDTLSDEAKKHLERVREKMQFVLEPAKQSPVENGMGIFANNGTLHANDIQAQIQKIFGKLNSQDLSPRANHNLPTKRPCVNSPGMREAQKRNVDSPQIVTTWVPPKEDALAHAFAAVAAANPTATAQIMTSQDSHPFSGLFTIDAGFAKTGKTSHTNGNKRGSAHLDAKEDKWSLLGRLVEQTCRELETKDMETAVHLQRELSEVLCKYQLASLKKA